MRASRTPYGGDEGLGGKWWVAGVLLTGVAAEDTYQVCKLWAIWSPGSATLILLCGACECDLRAKGPTPQVDLPKTACAHLTHPVHKLTSNWLGNFCRRSGHIQRCGTCIPKAPCIVLCGTSPMEPTSSKWTLARRSPGWDVRVGVGCKWVEMGGAL